MLPKSTLDLMQISNVVLCFSGEIVIYSVDIHSRITPTRQLVTSLEITWITLMLRTFLCISILGLEVGILHSAM